MTVAVAVAWARAAAGDKTGRRGRSELPGRGGDLGGQGRDLQHLAGTDEVRPVDLVVRLAQYSTGQAFCLWYTFPAIAESESPDRMVYLAGWAALRVARRACCTAANSSAVDMPA